MSSSTHPSPHHFHIPVLGTGFSVDTPIKVARYGIDSVMSIVDDTLLEQARGYHARAAGLAYEPIPAAEEDSRARRVRAYLDLVDLLVKKSFEAVRASFPDGAEAIRYFELLPPCAEREAFFRLRLLAPGSERDALAASLRSFMRPGSADVNIMTKLDRIPESRTGSNAAYYSDASAALRGYAESALESAVVFSAGMNPRLFDYLASFEAFRPAADGSLAKRICVKVSDYRSAFVQGLQLAKKGLWVSEFRLESGLNCGGHVFPTKGLLMGPILEEFVQRRTELRDKIYASYAAAAAAQGRPVAEIAALPQRISAQGGVGTAAEHEFLRQRYGLSAIGWGTPFLLVSEATNADEHSLELLAQAKEADIVLSEASPLGVPFWIVSDCDSERRRKERIAAGKPGTSCPKGYLALLSEFPGRLRCAASAAYQTLKKKALAEGMLSAAAIAKIRSSVLAKACLCRDLAASFTKKIGLEPKSVAMLTAGPNLAYFSSRYTLSQMAAHIYGRLDLLAGHVRPHLFIAEARLYVRYLAAAIADAAACAESALAEKGKKYISDSLANLTDGLAYYEKLADSFIEDERARFLAALAQIREETARLLGMAAALPDAN